SRAGACDLVIGKVVMIHIKDEYIMPDGKLDVLKIRTLARLGYTDYTTVQEVFSMQGVNTKSVPGSCGWMNSEPLGKKE
ncbi:MAG: Nitrilotriacetate monooxygenase component, partial [Firmicutes bacterium]|nr:Nitrilotriacetate monooxygenase component [Bacillota bacterium]